MTEFNHEKLESIIGYTFHDPAMLRQAMCHSSYANEHRAEMLHDNERLEFLGDAVLEVISKASSSGQRRGTHGRKIPQFYYFRCHGGFDRGDLLRRWFC